jgi:hypothetical protein
MLAALAVLGGAVAVFAVRGPVPPEDGPHIPNYDRVMRVTEAPALADGRAAVMKIDGARTTLLDAVTITAADADRATTEAVRAALKASPSDLGAVNDAVARAQQIPEIKRADIRPIRPKLSPGLAAQVAAGDAEFFHVYLYDNCAQDGDIVKIRVDGEDFAIVPITHGGATLSIPKGTGQPLSVELVGVFDGGGGITVACRTSEGTYFTRRMHVGEQQTVTVVGP